MRALLGITPACVVYDNQLLYLIMRASFDIISTGVLIVRLSRIRGLGPLQNTIHEDSTHLLS